MISVTGARPEHYERLKLDAGVIQPWENGLRTDPNERGFEWWYFDCLLEDGSRLTAEIHTKPPFVSPSRPLTPFVSLTLDRPDGTSLRKALTGAASSFSASRERCDVRVGESRFSGDPASGFEIHVEVDGVALDARMTAEVPSWRPGTGHVFFGQDEAQYLAWLPAVPRGDVAATITVEGRTERLRGVGYHDHNWGNVAIRRVVDHWYWAHARVGDYTVVALMFRARGAYGGGAHPAFMVAKGGEIVASGLSDMAFSASDPAVHAGTGVPFARRLVYSFGHGDATYDVTFAHDRTLFEIDFGEPGAYLRFAGGVTLEHRVAGALRDTARDDALWELLYFGARS